MFSNLWNIGLPLGDTITNAPVNFTSWYGTGRGVITPWGGENQYVTLPSGYPSQVYSLSTQPFFLNYAMNVDPLGLTWNNNMGSSTISEAAASKGIQDAYSAGARDMDRVITGQLMAQLPKSLESLESQLTSAIKDDSLSSSQKAKLQKHLDEIKVLKERIERAKATATREQAEAFNKEVKALYEAICKTSDEINSELAKKSEDAKGSSDSSDEESTKVDDTEVDSKTGKPSSLTTPTNKELRDTCNKLFTAIDGIGTDNGVIEAVIPTIDENNVVEIMQKFDDLYNKNHDPNQTLMVRLMNDLGHFEKKKYAPLIMNALLTRAEALGIDKELDEYVGTITKELSSWFIDEDVVGKALDDMCKKIVEKEKANVKETKKKSDADKTKEKKETDKTKAEEKAKNAKEVENKKAEFLRDMKIALKLDKTSELSDKVTVETNEDGSFKSFKVVIEGVTYEAYTYAQLVEKIKQYGYKPEDYLVKKNLDAAA